MYRIIYYAIHSTEKIIIFFKIIIIIQIIRIIENEKFI